MQPGRFDAEVSGPDRLLGRAAECRTLDGLLAGARQGRSGRLIVRGEVGVGKTALLEYAAAASGSVRVLRATGVAFESGLAFATLHELLCPVLDRLDDLPEVQAHALRRAFSLSRAGAADRLAVYSATLSLLATVGESAPVICLVDDADQVDRASAEALLFVARRMATERVAIVFAARDLPGFTAPGVPELPLAGLDPPAGVRLAMCAGLSSRVASQLVEATAGNPLALVEVPAALTEAQRQGRVPADLSLWTASRVAAAFLAPARSLAEPVRRALVVCAAEGGGTLAVLARALSRMGSDLRVLDAAVAAGLLTVRGESVGFRHPLVRAAVYSAAGPGLRREAHLAMSTALRSPDEADRRAWQLAMATPGPDERIAAALAETADRALERGGVMAQAQAWEQAARLSECPDARARRLLRSAGAWLSAGVVEHAEALLTDVVHLTREPDQRCRAQAVRGYLALQRGDTSAVGDGFTADAESMAGTDPLAAATMMSTTVSRAWARLDLVGMLRVCRRVVELGGADVPGSASRPGPAASARSRPVWPRASIRLAGAQLLIGQQGGAELARACVPMCRAHPADGSASELAEILTWLGEYGSARVLLERDIAEARRRHDLLLLAHALPRLATLEARLGRLPDAHRAAVEAVHVAGQVGQRSQRAHALASLTLVTALLGDEDGCRTHADQAALVSPQGFLDIETKIRYAVGVLALGAGRYADAAVDLEWVADVLRRAGVAEPGLLPVAADLAESYARLSRQAEATAVVEDLEAAAARTGRSGVRAAAARCRGLLAPDAAFEEFFCQALALHDAVDGTPLERARTLLCSGQRLRRAKRRRKARHHLYAALALFEQFGAANWARQCQSEINATGRHRPPHAGTAPRADPAQLTAQEWQIALSAMGGLTNREIADRVYLSPKTVDYHLGHIYRKLGLRSRNELIRYLSLTRSGTHDPATPAGGVAT